jgi:hypothetical protein
MRENSGADAHEAGSDTPRAAGNLDSEHTEYLVRRTPSAKTELRQQLARRAGLGASRALQLDVTRSDYWAD